jgi:hypothetical protein
VGKHKVFFLYFLHSVCKFSVDIFFACSGAFKCFAEKLVGVPLKGPGNLELFAEFFEKFGTHYGGLSSQLSQSVDSNTCLLVHSIFRDDGRQCLD